VAPCRSRVNRRFGGSYRLQFKRVQNIQMGSYWWSWMVSSSCCYENIFPLGVRWDWVHLVRRPLIDLLYQHRIIHDNVWSSWWNENWQGKPKYSEKTCASATLSTTNPTWSDLGSNPGRCGGKPATKCLSYDTAFATILLCNEKTKHNRPLWVAVQGLIRPTPYTYM
jgi:hypothetical protein